jgi:hypothetical protein
MEAATFTVPQPRARSHMRDLWRSKTKRFCRGRSSKTAAA